MPHKEFREMISFSEYFSTLINNFQNFIKASDDFIIASKLINKL